MLILPVYSFIDYENVDLTKNPVEQLIMSADIRTLSLSESSNLVYKMPLTDYRVSLQDNLV